MNIRYRHLIPVAALSIAAAIAAAPAAGASSDTGCRQSGTSTLCQKPGHSSMYAKPQLTTPSGGLFGSPWLPGYGQGLLPPLLALD